MSKGKAWSEEEIEVIKEYYPNGGVIRVANKLIDIGSCRSHRAINIMASSLNLKSNKTRMKKGILK